MIYKPAHILEFCPSLFSDGGGVKTGGGWLHGGNVSLRLRCARGYNEVLKRRSIEQLINPEINLICFHNKALLAGPASKRYLSAFLRDYARPNHLPGSSHESH